MPETDESALFGTEVVQAAPAKAPTRKRRSPTEVPLTPSGESAQAIIAEWIAFLQSSTGVPVPQEIIKRMGKQVKELIVSGYTTNQIKNGLTVWTTRWMDRAELPPERLATITWHVCTATAATGPSGRTFKQELEDSVRRLNPHAAAIAAPPTSNQERRALENARGKSDWRARNAERQQRKKELGL